MSAEWKAINKALENLNAAREVIDGEMNCNTPEFRAADLLWRAVDNLHTATQTLAQISNEWRPAQ